MRDAGTRLAARVTLPAAAAGGGALAAAAKVETLTTSFETLLGSADKATAMMKRLEGFSARTPFQLPDVADSARQLSLEVPEGRILPVLQQIGDTAAGAVQPINELAAIYAKTAAKGKAQTEELFQLAERGIPIISSLQKLGKLELGRDFSKQQILDFASEGKISFDVFARAFALMSAEGGKFHRQMERQSNTLGGLFSTLKDNVFLALADFGKALDEAFSIKDNMRRFIAWIGELRTAFTKLREDNPALVKWGLRIAGIVAVVGPALIALGAAAAIVGLGLSGLAAIFGILAAPLVLAGAKIMAIVGLIAGAAYLLIYEWDEFKGFWIGLWERVKRTAGRAWDWLLRQWQAVKDAIAAPAAAVFAWLGLDRAGVFAWIGRQWQAVKDAIAAPAAAVFAWLGLDRAGVFAWIGRQWQAVKGRHRRACGGRVRLARPRPRRRVRLDRAAVAGGEGRHRRACGGRVRLARPRPRRRVRLDRAAVAGGEGRHRPRLRRPCSTGSASTAPACSPGSGGNSARRSRGLRQTWRDFTGFFRKLWPFGDDEAAAPKGGRRAPAGDFAPAFTGGVPMGVRSIFDRRQRAYSGAGPGELAAARFQGELRIVIDQQGRARVRELRSDNRDIDLVAETGFSMASP